MVAKGKGYSDRMEPHLLAEVERQLLEDLERYGVKSAGAEIDWSHDVAEGHGTLELGGYLQSVSGLIVRDKEENAIAEGWMDFVHGGGDDPLFVFWLFLSIHADGEWRHVKDKPDIPEYIWERLSEKAKRFSMEIMRYDEYGHLRSS